jgi:hypothetical protein
MALAELRECSSFPPLAPDAWQLLFNQGFIPKEIPREE